MTPRWATVARDILLSVWMALVAAAYWGFVFGFRLSNGVLTALYALFLVVAIVSLARRLLKPHDDQQPDWQTGDSRRGR